MRLGRLVILTFPAMHHRHPKYSTF
jgi:hypothetical protein